MKDIKQRKWLSENNLSSESPKEHYIEAFKRLMDEIKSNQLTVET